MFDYSSRTCLPLKDTWQSSGCSSLWWLTWTQVESATVTNSHSHAWPGDSSQWRVHTTGAASLPTSSSFTIHWLQFLDWYAFLWTGHQEQKTHVNMTKDGYDGQPHVLIWSQLHQQREWLQWQPAKFNILNICKFHKLFVLSRLNCCNSFAWRTISGTRMMLEVEAAKRTMQNSSPSNCFAKGRWKIFRTFYLPESLPIPIENKPLFHTRLYLHAKMIQNKNS